MKELPPRRLRSPMRRDERDDLWSETLSAVGLIGTIALLVVVISFVAGR